MKNFALKIFVTTVILFYSVTVIGNNIQVSNLTLTGKNTTDHFMLVQFDISWENSWRTSLAPCNWDAAWVFVKYRIPGGEWQHAWLNENGHTVPAGTTIIPGLLTPGVAFNASTNPGLGTFIYRSDDGTGTLTATGLQLRWNYGDNGVTDADVVEIKVFAIEMVYVPQGSFSVGDGTTTNVSGQFTAHNTTGNFQITGELVPATLGGTTAGNLGNNNMTGMDTPDDFNNASTKLLPADFPKGYNAFYCMKYEISQQGYVDFLNTLTQVQANERKFDKPAANNYRYEISGSGVGSYLTTAPYLACNFLNWNDVAAYLDWSGLRPMTELEYEKACRGTGTATANEYTWGSTAITQNTGITNADLINETSTNGGNCSYGSQASVQGPMRVGALAKVSTTRTQSGASFNGIMDMSGNLKERTMTLGGLDGRNYTGLHGNGSLTVSGNADVLNWLSTGAGFRGGDWNSPATLARVSARPEVNNTSITRGNNYGGRGVRTQPLPQVTTTIATSITHDSATTGGNVLSDGGCLLTARGVCWSTASGPTIALSTKTTDGSGTGAFSSIISGLSESTLYYARAYATNAAGTSYGNEISFTTPVAPFECGSSSITVNHVTTGGVAPENKTVTYGTVSTTLFGGTKCAITRNLGASQQATSVSDATEASAGWYWKFNRKQGYNHTGQTETTVLTPAWTSSSINENSNWAAANDPCTIELGAGWRLPTNAEWVTAASSWSNWTQAFNSSLKLHGAGNITTNGFLVTRGVYGAYWSSTQFTGAPTRYNGYQLYIDSGNSYTSPLSKACGVNVRCIKN